MDDMIVICHKCGKTHRVKRGECVQCDCGEWIYYDDDEDQGGWRDYDR